MKISNLQFAADINNHINTFYYKKKIHIIFPNHYHGNLTDNKITSFDQENAHFQCRLIANIAVQLMRNTLSPEMAVKISELLINDTEACDKILCNYGDLVAEFIKKGDYLAQYNSILKRYIDSVIFQACPVVVVGFDDKHPLLRMLINEQVSNCEVIFIGSHTDSTGVLGNITPNNQIIKNRSILLGNTENWHKSEHQPIEGIEIIDCSSAEQEAMVIKNLVDDYDSSDIVADDLQLLQRLEILLADFSYDKPAILNFFVTFLLRILEGNIAVELLRMPCIKRSLQIEELVQNKESLFQGLNTGNEFIAAHMEYFKIFSYVRFSEVAKDFISDLKNSISSLKIISLDEYQVIFSLLSRNMSYTQLASVEATQSSNVKFLNGDVVIISATSWKNKSNFYQLLHIKKIFIVHKKSSREPEWLLKLRVLLPEKCINTYMEARDLVQENIGSIADPTTCSRPKILSATMVGMLVRDPYAFYLRYILKLMVAESGAMNFGIFTHKALEKYVGGNGGYNFLLQLGNEELKKYSDVLQSKSLWWPKFKNIAKHFVERDEIRMVHVDKIELEVELSFEIMGYTITVKCDRLEHMRDGSIAIIEYKTGSLPSSQDIGSGLSPQLLLQGIAANKAFKNEISELIYWQLKPDGIMVKKIPNVQGEMAITMDRLRKLFKNFAIMKFNSTGYYKNYQHIARTQEVFL